MLSSGAWGGDAGEQLEEAAPGGAEMSRAGCGGINPELVSIAHGERGAAAPSDLAGSLTPRSRIRAAVAWRRSGNKVRQSWGAACVSAPTGEGSSFPRRAAAPAAGV